MDSVKVIESLYGHISKLAEDSPEGPALLGCDEEGKIYERINFKLLKEKIQKAGTWLGELGLKRGDVVGLGIPNSTELLLISWAAWARGIITAPLDEKRDTVEQHLYKLRLTKAKVLIAKAGVFNKNEIEALKEFKFAEIGELPEIAKISWEKGISHQALILFTSGTTAKPKGAQLSLENLLANADGIREWFKITGKDRFMVNLPLHHINSTTFCLANLLAGAAIVIPPNYSKSRFWQQAAEIEATFTSIVPTIAYDQLDQGKEFEKFKRKLKLNRIQIGSAPVVVNDAKKFMEMFGIPLYQGYGQTETALRVTGVPLDLDEQTYQKLVDTNSIGKVMKFAEIEILDGGKVLEEGQEGEIAVKGPIVMKGYLGNHEAFKNGYFMTGDIGYYKMINGERFYFMKGRSKEIIIKGGINISPVAVEDKLKQISSDIDQAYVVGVDDKRYGQEVAAVICWKDVDIEKAIALLKYRLTSSSEKISRYETPQFITRLDPKELPFTSTGKVQRSVLQKRGLKFEPVNLIASNKEYRFLRLTSDKPAYAKQTFELYNYCWQPLSIDRVKFSEQVKKGIVIIAVDKEDKVGGCVSLLRTNLSEEKLSKITYDELTKNQTLSSHNPDGETVVCTSVCGDNYKPEPIPEKTDTVSVEKVREYLKSDAVYNFHAKAKGGFDKGAELVSLIPGARPEDERSLGYNMLMKYPEIGAKVKISSTGSVAAQLIEAAMVFAQQLGVKNVYVFSRPIGLAAHFD